MRAGFSASGFGLCSHPAVRLGSQDLVDVRVGILDKPPVAFREEGLGVMVWAFMV